MSQLPTSTKTKMNSIPLIKQPISLIKLPDNYSPNGVKSVICKYYILGTCKKGDLCPFKHKNNSSTNNKEKLITPKLAIVQLNSKKLENNIDSNTINNLSTISISNTNTSTNTSTNTANKLPNISDNFDFDDSIYNFGVPIENIDFNPSLSKPKNLNYATIASKVTVITEPPIIRGFTDSIIDDKSDDKIKCVFFNMGNCRYGQNCKNIHDYNEIKDNIEEIIKQVCANRIIIYFLLPF